MGMAMAWLIDVATITTGIAALFAIAAAADRALNGRIRELLQRWLAIPAMQQCIDQNGSRLTSLHDDQQEMMGAQVALARNQQQLTELVCDEHNIPERRRPVPLDVDELEQHAAESGATWPGEFLGGDDD